MRRRVLLVNPPIYDFSAYDFWLKPYGLLRVGGRLRGQAEVLLFDYLDRCHPSLKDNTRTKSDSWGRGRFTETRLEKPRQLAQVPRYFRRFGLGREIFGRFLGENGPFDFVLIGTTMTYWYPGVKEVIEDVRNFYPEAKIVLGGVYATVCFEHAGRLGADVVVRGEDFGPLWSMMGVEGVEGELPFWEGYGGLETGVIKITQGCPFRCSYCLVPQLGAGFSYRSLEQCLAELEFICSMGAGNIAFYDDALLFRSEEVLVPFLKEVERRGIRVNFHTPNALHARMVTRELAELMVGSGFGSFYLGFESSSRRWQEKTGAKVFSEELETAVEHLAGAGVARGDITAYEMLGHPHGDMEELEKSMRFVSGVGIRIMLADFSPIPGTPDGQFCSRWVDISEPLNHNKTAYPIMRFGADRVNRLKDLCRRLNSSL